MRQGHLWLLVLLWMGLLSVSVYLFLSLIALPGSPVSTGWFWGLVLVQALALGLAVLLFQLRKQAGDRFLKRWTMVPIGVSLALFLLAAGMFAATKLGVG